MSPRSEGPFYRTYHWGELEVEKVADAAKMSPDRVKKMLATLPPTFAKELIAQMDLAGKPKGEWLDRILNLISEEASDPRSKPLYVSPDEYKMDLLRIRGALIHEYLARFSGLYAKDSKELIERMNALDKFWASEEGRKKLTDMGLDSDRILSERHDKWSMGPAEQMMLQPLLLGGSPRSLAEAIPVATDSLSRVFALHDEIEANYGKHIPLIHPYLRFDSIARAGPTDGTYFPLTMAGGGADAARLITSKSLTEQSRRPASELTIPNRPVKIFSKDKIRKIASRIQGDFKRQVLESSEFKREPADEGWLDGVMHLIGEEIRSSVHTPASLSVADWHKELQDTRTEMKVERDRDNKTIFETTLEKLEQYRSFLRSTFIMSSIAGKEFADAAKGKGVPEEVLQQLVSNLQTAHAKQAQSQKNNPQFHLPLSVIQRNVTSVITSGMFGTDAERASIASELLDFLITKESDSHGHVDKYIDVARISFQKYNGQRQVNFLEFATGFNDLFLKRYFPNRDMPARPIDDETPGSFGMFFSYIEDMGKLMEFLERNEFVHKDDKGRYPMFCRISIQGDDGKYKKFSQYRWDPKKHSFTVNDESNMDFRKDAKPGEEVPTGNVIPEITLQDIKDRKDVIAIPLKELEYLAVGSGLTPRIAMLDDNTFYEAYRSLAWAIKKLTKGHLPPYYPYLPDRKTGYET
ncbi:hypothetical protein HY969_00500 [Candidatus Kaiserbacteria bacterium]|nr:hypothetical protein [Candidatus Kaiserbacteria bacterium]